MANDSCVMKDTWYAKGRKEKISSWFWEISSVEEEKKRRKKERKEEKKGKRKRGRERGKRSGSSLVHRHFDSQNLSDQGVKFIYAARATLQED